MQIAQTLESHPAVLGVNYPGLPSHRRHARARELFDGFSGMLSFELKGGSDAAERFLDRVTLPANAPSLGGVESLITRPAASAHVGMNPDARRRLGISDGLIRFSVGLESADDLIADFDAALQG